MKTPMTTPDRFLVAAAAPRLRDRAIARLRSRRLDRALAGGTPPESSAALALRSRRLTAASHRRSTAAAYRLLVSDTEDRRGSRARIVPRRARVLSAADKMRHLADALDRPGPVAAQGVAQALLLLSDGTGPLYNAHSSESLEANVASAAASLPVREQRDRSA